MKTELFTRYIVKCEDGTNYFMIDEFAKDDVIGMAGKVKVQLVEDWHTKQRMIEYLESVIEKLKTF